MPFPSSTCSLATHTCVQASSFALAVVFFFLPVIKLEVLTNSVRYIRRQPRPIYCPETVRATTAA